MANEMFKSRQWRMAAKRRDSGVCIVCKASEADDNVIRGLCDVCRMAKAVKARNKYRESVGIPIDAPVDPRGRPAHPRLVMA